MDDDELIARLAGGDDGALRELFHRHAPWLAARLGRVLASQDVEDVLQETFLAVWRSAAGYRPVGSAGGWLWVIAHRQAAAWLRRHGRDPSPVDDLVLAALRGPDPVGDVADTVVNRAELAAAVAALGPATSTEREVWHLYYVQDQPVHEVAQRLGVPSGTVKSRAHRVRRLMQAALLGRAAREEGL
ncbi:MULTISPECIES: RNA polymerase sigma factor [Streptacidiphilus]|uniref:RNA polymerase sigma factor n=1 Tax=Streptacidiphilus cavernicola TaxID=3342716 RepID=A0ABV6UVT6_9ACTN|nr:RNA polymerase sigma factor [Streptacidiphilus jeojiense]